MNKALIVVDVQPDFLPGGPLGVPDGDKVIPELIKMMDDVDVIVLTRDWHPEDHVSFSDEPEFVDGSWPKHCVNFTPGAIFHHDILVTAQSTGKPVVLVHKGFEQDMEAYSGFDGRVVSVLNEPQGEDFRDSTLEHTLRTLGVGDVYVGGLALDYCVKATALDSVAKQFATSVYLKATRPVGLVSGGLALLELTSNNVHIKGE